jgi:parvulin-like peptidyl-prolyl isomerase
MSKRHAAVLGFILLIHTQGQGLAGDGTHWAGAALSSVRSPRVAPNPTDELSAPTGENGLGGHLADRAGQLIALELFRREAERRGYYRDPAVAAAPQSERDAAAVRRLLQDAVRPAPVPESAVRASYDAILESLGPTEYLASLIALGNETQARSLLRLLKSGADFDALARSRGRASPAAAGTGSGWFSFPLPPADGRTGGLPLPVARTLTQLRPGMVAAEPIAHGGTWYVVRLDAARPTEVPTYQQASGRIRQMLELRESERAAAAFVAGLIRRAEVEP